MYRAHALRVSPRAAIAQATAIQWFTFRSHQVRVPVLVVTARIRPSGLKATPLIVLVLPDAACGMSRTPISTPDPESQRVTELLAPDADATSVPSALTATGLLFALWAELIPLDIGK